MDDELDAIEQSIMGVLNDQCSSLALHAYIDGKLPLADELRQRAVDLGWLAIGLPEEAGGLGFGSWGLATLHRALGRVSAPGDVMAQTVALNVLARHDRMIESTLIADVIAGAKRIAIPARPADATQPRLHLGDPSSEIALTLSGDHDLALVELSGCVLSAADIWDSTRTVFDIPEDAGATIAVLPGARVELENAFGLALAADSVGLACGIAERTLSYMKERRQFDRTIASFQALKHRMADIFLAIETTGHLVDQAAESAAKGDATAALWAMEAKASATDMAAFVAGDCVQLHGGVGYTWEYDPHIYLKRARLNEMLLGANGTLRDLALGHMAQAMLAGVDIMELAS